MLTRDDVLVIKHVFHGKNILRIVAAPCELDGVALFNHEVIPVGKGALSALWEGGDPYQAASEWVVRYEPTLEWEALAEALGDEEYAAALAEYQRDMALVERAKANDPSALEMLNFYRRMGWRPPEEPPKRRIILPSLSESKTCRHCRQDMLAYYAYYRYCSERCRREHTREQARQWAKANRPSRAKAHPSMTCQACGEVFYPRRADARYCSLRCRVRAHRAHRTPAV